MRINSNIHAMTALRNYDMHVMKVGKSTYRLSTGKKLPSDDPAGMMIAEKFRARIRELDVYIRKTEEMQDMLDCVYSETMARQSILQRMRELSVSMASDTLSKDEITIIAAEFAELAKEFGIKTFEKTGMEIVSLRIGEAVNDFVFKKGDMVYIDGEWKEISELEKKHISSDGSAAASTTGLIDYVDGMMKQNLLSAAALNAFSSRLSFRLERLFAEEENAIAALSRIEDIDIASEIVEYVKEKLLAQTALAIAAQANAMPGQVLKLLETLPDTETLHEK